MQASRRLRVRVWMAVLGLVIGLNASASSWAVAKPKLLVVVVVDQFRADYISRFQSHFGKNGFNALIGAGAYFPYGEYDLLQSMTGPGHATVLTGAYPYQMGIPINDWYDQKTHANMNCVEDVKVKTIGALKEQAGSSPRNLLGSTVGDELKNADWPSKVVGVALKDRAAILLGGHRADLALWFDFAGKKWITSTYYRKDGKLPEWMNTMNVGVKPCDYAKPCGLDMTTAAAKAALAAEKLGQGKGVDILAISYSSFDIAGHHFGPNAPEMREMTLALDKNLAELRAAVALRVPGGLKNVVFVVTGDHGVSPTTEYLADTGFDSGRIQDEVILKQLNEYMNKKYGAPKTRSWVDDTSEFNFYLDEENIHAAKLDIRRVETEIKQQLLQNPGFAFVFTEAEWEDHVLPPGMFARKIEKTYYHGRSGHVIAIQKPYFVNDSKSAANHMTGYSYDRTVPIVFSGFGIKNGLYSTHTEVVDIAPTLAFLVGVLPPSMSEGRVLSEALK